MLVVDDLQDDKDEFQQVIDEYKDKINLKVFYLEGKTGVSAAEMIRAWICTMCMITMIQKIFIMIMSMSLMIYRMQRITGKRTDDISIGRIKIRRVLCK